MGLDFHSYGKAPQQRERVEDEVRLGYFYLTNRISDTLDSLVESYKRMLGRGDIEGLLLVDSDGKALAKSRFFRVKNAWNAAALGAALAGLAKQGENHLGAEEFQNAMIIYDSKQFYVCRIGKLDGDRSLLLLVLANERANIGFIRAKLNQYVKRIEEDIEKNETVKKIIEISEEQIEDILHRLDAAIIREKEGS
ncbi:MAG: roadblock/LC7 domain-containing protein [Candidatus Freyrarchaeum guaymaensis]|nr:roadblock/LC7 domain-containing protein [Candidatus Sigynarchaeota archaeon]